MSDLPVLSGPSSVAGLVPSGSPLEDPALLPVTSFTSVAFVDATLADAATLIDGLSPDTAVYLLNPTGDELSQIGQVLANYSNLSAVSVFSHGSEGALYLGNTRLGSDTLIDYAGVLQSWAGALSAEADLLLFACNLAANATGQSLVSQIAALTGADVAASTDLTGSSDLGGDWDLEFATGSIEASEFLSDWAQSAYQNVLATFTVTNLNNDGAGSLRQAILDANAAAGADTITFTGSTFTDATPDTITLTSGQLAITDSLIISGTGANRLTISGNNATRVFQVNGGATATLNGLTITGGNVNGDGGGILSSGNLTINNSTLSNNTANNGGGLYTDSGTLTLTNSTLSNNTSGRDGGGLYTSSTTVTVTNTTFSGNQAQFGGGLYEVAASTIVVSNSTFSGNTATGQGGGIWLGIPNLTSFTLRNSIVSGNNAPDGREIFTFGNFISGGNNLFGFSGNSGLVSFSAVATDSVPTGALATIINPLASNGGATQTHALVAGSAAIDKGSNALIPAGITADQRGFVTRTVGGTVDIGAFEFGAVPPPNSAPVATNDSFTTNEDTALTVPATNGVLANDTDADSNPLTASLVNGPSNGSLSLNANGSFTYTPNTDFNGTDSFTYRANDGMVNSNTATVTLTITPVNDAPVVANPLSDQSSPENAAVNFTIPANTFSDVDNPTLALSATLADGATLPGWLSFNAATRTFSGTPPLNFNDTLSIKVTASDGVLSTADTFDLVITPVNDAPVLANPIANQSSPEDAAVNFTIPANTFSDGDGDTLTLSAALANGSSLPGWLSFNATTRTFSGTPPLNFNGTLSIQVTASDDEFSIADTFDLVITPVNDAPVLTAPASQNLLSGSGRAITGISITDVDAAAGLLTTTVSVTNGTLTFTNLSGSTLNGGALNSSTITLRGTLTQLNSALASLKYTSGSFTGNANLTVTVNDNGNTGSGGALSDSETIALRVAQGVNLGNAAVNFNGTVSNTDPIDSYQFSLASNTNKFRLTLGNLTRNADLVVYKLNADGSKGDIAVTSTSSGTQAEAINNQFLAAGTYLIEVKWVDLGIGSTPYSLSFSR